MPPFNHSKPSRAYLLALSLIFTVGLFAATTTMAQSRLIGNWEGAFVRENSVQLISAELSDSSGVLVGNYAIPEMGLFEEPIRELAVTDSSVTMRFRYGPFVLHRASDVDQLTGSNERWNPPLRLHLKRSSLPPRPWFTKIYVSFANGDTKLAGTVYQPIGAGPWPAVILVHGSGDQSRSVWEYRSHLYGLVSRGVAVLVYDKRGCGESSGDFRASTLDDLAGDAYAGLKALGGLSTIDADRCGIYGISQGGWVAAKLGAHHADLPFIVLNQGPAVSLWEQDLHRVEYSLRADDYHQSAIDSALALTKLYFDSIDDQSLWQEYLAMLNAVDSAAWLEYAQAERVYDDENMLWWRMNRYDPADDFARLSCRVFAVFGADDANIPPAENQSLLDSLLTTAGVEHADLVVPHLPHSVTTYQTLRGGEWHWPHHYWQWAYRPQFDDSIARWINTRH